VQPIVRATSIQFWRGAASRNLLQKTVNAIAKRFFEIPEPAEYWIGVNRFLQVACRVKGGFAPHVFQHESSARPATSQRSIG